MLGLDGPVASGYWWKFYTGTQHISLYHVTPKKQIKQHIYFPALNKDTGNIPKAVLALLEMCKSRAVVPCKACREKRKKSTEAPEGYTHLLKEIL